MHAVGWSSCVDRGGGQTGIGESGCGGGEGEVQEDIMQLQMFSFIDDRGCMDGGNAPYKPS